MAASLASTSLTVKSLSSASSAFSGAAVSAPQRTSVVKVGAFQCRAAAQDEEAVSRRGALALVAGAAALSLKASPALAAYGEAGTACFALLLLPAEKCGNADSQLLRFLLWAQWQVTCTALAHLVQVHELQWRCVCSAWPYT